MSEPMNEEIEPRTPPIVYSALVFALLGFACGIPAVLGLVLGIIGLRRARIAGTGLGLATAAIWISVAWLVGLVLLVVFSRPTTS